MALRNCGGSNPIERQNFFSIFKDSKVGIFDLRIRRISELKLARRSKQRQKP
jgi:hypothetical protein